jgi:hypothetical protein
MSQHEKHEFEPLMICANCDNLHEDCECDETEPQETDECELCSRAEDNEIHDMADDDG